MPTYGSTIRHKKVPNISFNSFSNSTDPYPVWEPRTYSEPLEVSRSSGHAPQSWRNGGSGNCCTFNANNTNRSSLTYLTSIGDTKCDKDAKVELTKEMSLCGTSVRPSCSELQPWMMILLLSCPFFLHSFSIVHSFSFSPLLFLQRPLLQCCTYPSFPSLPTRRTFFKFEEIKKPNEN